MDACQGGLSNWKLNAYTVTLDVNSVNNGLTYIDDASKNDNANWFYGVNGYAYFKVYPGNPTDSGSCKPRTELREMNATGSAVYNWDGSNGTEHSMKWKLRVDNLPPSGKLCFGQIHSTASVYDDVIRVQVQGSNGQSSGNVTLWILGYATETLLGSGQTVAGFTFTMNTEYFFELTMQNQTVKLYALDASGTRINTLITSGAVNSNSNYFKAGNYSQSTVSADFGSALFGLVGIRFISVTH